VHLVAVLRRLLNWDEVLRFRLAATLGVRCQDGTGHNSSLLPRVDERPEESVVCHPVGELIAIKGLYLSE